MKQSNKKKIDCELVLIISIFVVLLALLKLNQIKYQVAFEIMFLILVVLILLYVLIVYSPRFKNLNTFILLLTSHLILLPILQIIIYANDSKQFAIDPNFINQKENEIENELRDYRNSEILSELLKSKRLKNSDFSRYNEYISEDSTKFIIKSQGEFVNNHPAADREERRSADYHVIIIIRNTDSIIIRRSEEISSKDAIRNLLKRKSELLRELNNPNRRIERMDLWLDSISGFLLGNIKPNSKLSQVVQLVQIFLLSTIAILFGDFIVNMDSLKIRPKNQKNKNG